MNVLFSPNVGQQRQFSAVALPDGTPQLCRVSRATTPPAESSALMTSPDVTVSSQANTTAWRAKQTARSNCSWPLSWSEECSTQTRFRSSGNSGRRGRLGRELIACVAGKNSYCDCCCFIQAVQVVVCLGITGGLCGSPLNRPNWLPFKPALTVLRRIR